MLEELQVDQYFTLVFAEVNLVSGHLQLVQAGHPHPLILRRGGKIDRLGHGGLPIGLIEGASFDRVESRLSPGDRLLLLSDGLTECPGPGGDDLGEDGLIRMIRNSHHLASPALLEALVWDLSAWAGGEDFPDDVSGLLFDYRGT